jgi:hypothetical protein
MANNTEMITSMNGMNQAAKGATGASTGDCPICMRNFSTSSNLLTPAYTNKKMNR